ncbi:MAG TPA: ABC transporter substrate-binding protein [Candidatus Limnocylindria bacterium]|nr:ABC transporter substrate-binding protein [Candidatus Limnocylindria bacterium]
MRKTLSLILALVLVLSVSSAVTAQQFKGTIKLGGLAPLTGNYAEYGKGFQIAWNMAIDEINAAGGANGYKLEIDVKDSQGDPVVSSTLATAFAEDEDIMAILGDFSSGASKANAPIIDRYGLVQLSPTASAPDYAGMSPFAFSIMGRQDSEAPFFAKYVIKKYLGAQNVAVIRVDSDWGAAAFANFKRQADIEGLTVTEEKYKSDETDFSSIITKVKTTNPDVLMVMDQGLPVAAIFNAADSAGWDVPHVALGPGTSQQLVDQLIDPEGLIVSSPFFFDKDNPTLVAWKDAFTAKAGFQPTVHPAVAYDTVYLIKGAIEAIGDAPVTREAIRDALQNLEITGLTGRIKFQPEGDITREYLIAGVENGEWKVLEGFEYGRE